MTNLTLKSLLFCGFGANKMRSGGFAIFYILSCKHRLGFLLSEISRICICLFERLRALMLTLFLLY